MKKRIFLAALMLVLVMGMGTALAGTAIGTIETGETLYEEGDWYYYSPDGTSVTLFQYNNDSETTIVFPEELDGKAVTAALPQAVSSGFTSVTVPASFHTVPEHMFQNKTALQTVVLSDGITGIGQYAFFGCGALENVTLPDTLNDIGFQAFTNCTALSAVSIPGGDGLVIGKNAFYGCTSLSELTLGEGAAEIGEAAFYGTALTGGGVSLPASLERIGKMAFCQVDTLAELDIPDGVAEMDLPIVDNTCVMTVGDGTEALAQLLADGTWLNYRIRGTEYTPDVPVQATASEQVQAIVAAVVTDGMSDYQKALALHDYLTEHAQYNMAYEDEANDPYHETNHEAEGVLLHGTGVCESYTKAYGLLLDAVGIPNTAQVSETHTWNVVQLDGEWYHIDVTWDDPTSDTQGKALEWDGSGNLKFRSGRERHTFFCLPDYALEGVSEHEFTGENIPAAQGWELNYSYVHGGLNSRLSQLREGIGAQLAGGNTSFTLTGLDAFSGVDYGIADRTALYIAAEKETYTADGTEYTIGDGYACAAGTATLSMEAVNTDPVVIEAPAEAVLGQELQISWSITDEDFAYENASISITEIKGDYRAFRDDAQELSGRSGTVSYTPEAGDRLEIWVNFWDGEYEELFTWERSYELTGTPGYDLQMIDGTVEIALNRETNEMEARYALTGGNGSFSRLEYMWGFTPEGGSDADFYQEGRANIEGNTGILKLPTAANGTYTLDLNIYDESGWSKRMGDGSFRYTVADGNGDVTAEILPGEVQAGEGVLQELTWKVKGGYTPFYRCSVNLQILDPLGQVLSDEAFESENTGTVSVILKDPGTYSAVFTVTTCDKDDNEITLDPITVPITVTEAGEPLFDLAVDFTWDKAERTVTASYDLGREVTESDQSTLEMTWYRDTADWDHYLSSDYWSCDGEGISRRGTSSADITVNPENQVILVVAITEGQEDPSAEPLRYRRQYTVAAEDLDFDPLPDNACGPNLAWAYADGTLTVSGTGRMFRYADGGTPWHDIAGQITGLRLEEGITEIPPFAFEHCGMEEVTIPGSVLSIEGDAFLECMRLQTVHIPAATQRINSGAFYISPVRTVTVDSANPYFCVQGGMLMNKDCTEIILIPRALGDVVIPEEVTTLPEAAFYASEADSVTLHAGIRNLNEFHFMDASIGKIVMDSGFEAIPENTFSRAEIGSLYIPATVRSVEANAFAESTLSDVYYGGTEKQFASVSVAETGNECFRSAKMHYQDPVVIEAPAEAVLGEELQISWSIADGDFAYEYASIYMTESKGDYRALRQDMQELSGRSGVMSYTPTAGDRLEVQVTFVDGNHRTVFSWKRTYELTGTPSYDLQLIGGTVEIALNSETNEVEARYALTGGNGSISRLQYMWEFYPEGGSDADFYQEGEADIEGNTGILKLATSAKGTYRLSLNLYDDSESSGWIKRIDNNKFSCTVTEGSDEVRAEILPGTFGAGEEAQELTWKVSGGYTPFHPSTVNLRILDPEEQELYNETAGYTNGGSASVILKDAGAYKAVFTITTCDKNGEDMTVERTVAFTAAGHEHEWGEAVYTWNEANTEVTASRTCLLDAQHVETETVPAEERITAPTETAEGYVRYVSAAFENEAFTVQEKTGRTIPALGTLSCPDFPAQIRAIGEEAFAGTPFQAVIIPDTVVEIGSRAFAGCEKLVYVFIPGSVESLAPDAFADCPNAVIVRIGN